MATLSKQSLVDQIYTELRNEIVSLKVPIGGKLNVSELQERFGISSTPIREALNRLQKEGLVEYKNNVGAKVIDIEEKDIIEIQAVSATLDSAAIRYAIKTGKLEQISQELLEKINSFQETNDGGKRLQSVEEFADVFYKYANNSRLIEMARLIKGQRTMLRNTYRKELKELVSIEDHINIYKAVLAGDVNSAIKSMEENHEKATEILLKIWQK